MSRLDRRLEHHISTNGLHEDLQSAYRKGHSTETALIKVQNDITEALDNKSVVVLVMLDLSAAFDTVDHHLLIKRLRQAYGVTGTALKWFCAYLSGRTQSVTVDGVQSEPVKLAFGVPQGSVLGPKLYCIYTKPIGQIIHSHGLSYHLYADDSQIYFVIKADAILQYNHRVRLIEQCVADIRKWMQQNLLKLNDEKTEVIVFASKVQMEKISSLTVTIGECMVHPTPCVRNLGVYYDSCLLLKQHIAKLCQSGHMHLRNISKIRQYLSIDAAKSLVHALVMSRLDYANALLFGLPRNQLDRLQRIQNIAARVITGTARHDHITPVLRQLHWLPICRRLEYKVLTHTFQAIHGTAPSYLCHLVTKYQPHRCLRSQDMNLLVVPRIKTATYGHRSFRHAAASLWNQLPPALKNLQTLSEFKAGLKAHLFKIHYN